MSLLHWKELDRGPNSIVSASKISSARQLQGYKEVANDPEFQALAQLKNQKVANDDLLQVYQMADEYKLIAMRLANFLHGTVSQSSAMAPASASSATASATASALPQPGGQPKSAKELAKERRAYERAQIAAALSAQEIPRTETAPGRKKSTKKEKKQSADPYVPPSPSPIGQEFPTESTTIEGSGRSRFYGGDRGAEYVDNQNLFYKLIDLSRKMNLILTSKIRNKLQLLTQADIDKLTDIFNMVQNSYNDVLGQQRNTISPYTYAVRNANNQSQHTPMEFYMTSALGIPMESLHLWNTERNALLITLTGIISAWRAISPTQSPIDPKTQNRFMTVASRSMQGAGRGMHGDMPNSMYLSDFMKSTNPHPLWYQNCPRKFLL